MKGRELSSNGQLTMCIKELLKKAGIDMTSPEPIEATIEVFDDLVDQLEQALAEIEAVATRGD